MAIIISLAIQKGGCAKTTSTLNLASAFSKKGRRVLVVDLDSQESLTKACGVVGEFTTYDLLVGKASGIDVSVDDAVIELEDFNFDILSGSLMLATVEDKLSDVKDSEHLLQQLLSECTRRYDYILLDCPPSLGLLTKNALIASDYVIIPCPPEMLAVNGLKDILNTIKVIQSEKSLNANLCVLGILVVRNESRVNALQFCIDEITEIAESEGIKVFKTSIPKSAAILESQVFTKSVIDRAPKSKPAVAYMDLAKEVMKEVKKGGK